MKKDLSIAMAIAKKNKKMAKGGKVKSDMDHGSKNGPEGYSKYQEQSQNQAGVHKPVSGVTGFPGGKGTSRAGDYAKDRHDGKAILNDEAKKEHHKVIEESRKMPKPNIKGLAQGGSVDTADTIVIPDRGHGKIIRTGLAEGGKVNKLHQGAQEARKYDAQKSEKGVHAPRMPYPHRKESMGESSAGYSAKGELNEQAKKQHHKVIEESRAMPKPKIQGLARGGMVESSLIKAHPLDAIGQILKDHEAHIESQIPPEDETEHMDYNDEHALHSQQMAEGGEVDDYGYPIKHPTPAPRLDAIKPAAPKPMQPKEKSIYDYAEGGEVMEDEDMMDEAEDEDHASIAAAIMAKRSKFAEGGQVDIDENAEEQSNMYYKLNQAALKENYDSDMDDVSQPEDSNEESDSIESDDHDKISVMRRKMALKRMAK